MEFVGRVIFNCLFCNRICFFRNETSPDIFDDVSGDQTYPINENAPERRSVLLFELTSSESLS